MLTGLAVWGVWVLFFHEKESAALGLCLRLFGQASIVSGTRWTVVDPIVIALPISSLVTVIGSLVTKPDVKAKAKVQPREERELVAK